MTTIFVPMAPVARPRQRYTQRAGKTISYTPSQHPVHTFKAAIAAAWHNTHSQPFAGPVEMSIIAFFPRPKSLQRKSKPQTRLWHDKRPDIENVAKSVLDALNGLAYHDDSQVASLTMAKYICGNSDTIGVEITVNQARRL
jgi:Holliday junction resolvase RusA-like endonuclease